jgi:NAD+ synthase (glutamine-hydrolysing)
MASFDILLKQLNPVKGIEANEKRIKDILAEDFDIAVFPEMFYSGYLIRDNVNFYTVNPRFISQLQSEIGDRMVIFGAPLREKFLYNTAFVVTKNFVQVYKKRHLPNFGPFEEMRYFKRGDTPLTVEFRGFRVGIEICYDLFFDDSVEKGIDILVNISASPFTSFPFFEKVFPARAIESQSYLVYVNNAGLQRNQVFWGGSRVLDSDGREILGLKKYVEDSGIATVESSVLDLSRRKRRVLSEVLDDSAK